jgi:hypothetical protein
MAWFTVNAGEVVDTSLRDAAKISLSAAWSG